MNKLFIDFYFLTLRNWKEKAEQKLKAQEYMGQAN